MIYIVCALHCEAKPLIDNYKLSLEQDAVFPVFSNEQIKVIVAGIGKISTAAAMAYLYARNQELPYCAWLNVGIAGHKRLPLGSLVNVNKISDDSMNWYPVRQENSKQLGVELITVDAPVECYESEALVDMEASAFMATALRFSPVELLQVLKVISDNEENHIDKINKKQVQQLIEKNLGQIRETINWLQMQVDLFAEIYVDSELYQQCVNQWHFSHYQQKQLKRLLQRWQALNENPQFFQVQALSNAKQVLSFVENEVNQMPVEY